MRKRVPGFSGREHGNPAVKYRSAGKSAFVKALILFTGLGVLTSLLLAMAASAFMRLDPTDRVFNRSDTPVRNYVSQLDDLLNDYTRDNSRVREVSLYHGPGHRRTVMSTCDAHSGPTSWLITVEESGFPVLCLRGAMVMDNSPSLQFDHAIYLGADSPHDYIRILPLEPIWTGLLIDVLIYSTAYWLVVLAWRGARVLLSRRKVPICRHCGYSLRGLRDTGCPECGSGRS